MEMKTAAVTGATSVAGAGTSFFVKTLPVVQWCAAAVAILAGAVTVLLGLIKLHAWAASRGGK